MHASFTNLEWYSKAARGRVFLNDPACNPPHRFARDQTTLRQAMERPTQMQTRINWRKWFNNAFTVQIGKNATDIINKVGSWENLRCSRRKNYIAPELDKTWRKETQSTIYKLLAASEAIEPWQRMRAKQDRWKLQEPRNHMIHRGTAIQETPRWRSEKACWLLRCLKTLVPPRVQSVVFSTCWNRWTTDDRFQKHSNNQGCVLGCGAGNDSIEQYCRCPQVQELLRRKMHLPSETFANLHSFTLTNPHITTQEELTLIAITIYATYTTTNRIRFLGRLPTDEVYNALVQATREGVKGHTQSTNILQTRWQHTREEHNLRPQPPFPFDPTIAKLRNLVALHTRINKRKREEEE